MIKFNNKPIIYWTLKHAFSSKVFNKIILSSDWNELLNYSKSKFKKLIINKRPLNLSKSNITSEKVINYLFKKYINFQKVIQFYYNQLVHLENYHTLD